MASHIVFLCGAPSGGVTGLWNSASIDFDTRHVGWGSETKMGRIFESSDGATTAMSTHTHTRGAVIVACPYPGTPCAPFALANPLIVLEPNERKFRLNFPLGTAGQCCWDCSGTVVFSHRTILIIVSGYNIDDCDDGCCSVRGFPLRCESIELQ